MKNNMSFLKKFWSINSIFYIFLLLAPFIYYVKYTQYGFANLPIIYMLISLLLLAIIISLVDNILGWTGKILIGTFIVTICLSFLPPFKSTIAVLLCFFFVLILHIVLDKHFRSILLIMTTVFILSTLLLPIQSQLIYPHEKKYPSKISLNKNLPPVIHLMFDEFAGINGTPTNIGNGQALRQHLENFFTKNGFHVYANAYSHYLRTPNSISNLVNFTSNPISHYYFKKDSPFLIQNQYFKIMGETGYKIRVYQFDSMINYCEPKKYTIESCYEYPAASLHSIKDLNFSNFNKYLFVLKSYLLWSQSYEMLESAYEEYIQVAAQAIDINLPQWHWNQARTSTLWLPTIFHQLIHDIIQHPNGTLFYAHILAPHNPYIFNAQCQLIKNPMQWKININNTMPFNSTQSRIERYKLYEHQVRCITSQLNYFFKKLKKAGIYKHAIIIINGDHGSRITKILPVIQQRDQMTLQDFHDCFNTMFAVKMPNASPTVSQQLVPIQKLLANIVSKLTKADIHFTETKPYVYLMTKGFHGKMVPLYLDPLMHKPTSAY